MALNPMVMGVLDNALASEDSIDPGFLKDWESNAVPMPQVGDPNWGAKYDPGFTVSQGTFNPLNPFSWFQGKPQGVREQVQKGEYEPEGPSVSPLDQILRNKSNRTKELQRVMDEAGW